MSICPKVSVLITCFNRKRKTIKCLEDLYQQEGIGSKFYLDVYLVDDGSHDGTSEEVEKRFPKVNLDRGDGNLYWNRGMHRAFSHAIKDKADYFLWLNDDTFIYPDTIIRLLEVDRQKRSQENSAQIVVGATRDPMSGGLTYGGYRRMNDSKLRSLRFKLLEASDEIQSCDGICGNCVLINAEAVKKIGNLDQSYRHRWGDIDYALRAGRAGCSVWLAPGYAGECPDNPNCDQWKNRNFSIPERLRLLHDIKGLGLADWFRFSRVHGGKFWFFDWIAPYVYVFLTSFYKGVGNVK